MGDLVQVLEGMPPPEERGDARVIVGTEFADDAAVVRVGDDPTRATVLTVDVIAPLVDDPETFGEIAACNALSDVYAMGGRPLFALNIVGFPDDKLPLSVLQAILRGAARACSRAGVAVVGGHTVRDGELKFGLSVTGEVAVSEVLSNRTGREGQALVLTKALGTGFIAQAIKQGQAEAGEMAAAIASMTTLNGPALAIARGFGVTACTDVTGFGLLGHLRNILRGSQLAARLDMAALPALPGALGHAAAGRVPGGSKANLAFVRPNLVVEGREEPLRTILAADAQTSGGLLLTVPAERAAALVEALRASGGQGWTIGSLVAPSSAMPAETVVLEFAADIPG
ncbi:selenide, water dikinase SelD [Nannocystis sp. bb15-2]|uniref:Selenide, water dikinase SelD n=1 Tax=Nannocystis bainbridge TaxID=2995303 RepID=A0ABT5E3Z0_9BACT|nr:selenide, water dikinase SelD [Nannocystis bainbridge]